MLKFKKYTASILCLFLVWIASLIIGLILRIFFGKEKRGAKLLGLALGAANFAIAFILLLLPLFGTLSLTSSILHDVASYQPENNEEELPLDEIIYYADLYEDTITKKYIPTTYGYWYFTSLDKTTPRQRNHKGQHARYRGDTFYLYRIYRRQD